jgi:hypothetical protein
MVEHLSLARRVKSFRESALFHQLKRTADLNAKLEKSNNLVLMSCELERARNGPRLGTTLCTEPGRLPDDRKLLTIFRNHESGSPFPSVDSFLDYFRQRPLKFFSSFEDRDATTQLQKGESSTAAELLARAEGICEGRFDLLGLKGLQFGTPPQWNLEPVLGKQTPQIHWSKLDYLDAQLAGDKKIIWELNRHQYFMILGRAYWLTGDEKYSAVFAQHLASWMDQNPPKPWHQLGQ